MKTRQTSSGERRIKREHFPIQTVGVEIDVSQMEQYPKSRLPRHL